MKWLPDYTHRFANYPFYENDELDIECESWVTEFLAARKGTVSYPLKTDDLMVLIERHTDDLDWNSDLSCYGDDVEGITHFVPGARPRVAIAKHLASAAMLNRFRMTLAHELAHVRLHDCLYQMPNDHPTLFASPQSRPLHCKREAIAGRARNDWMEWQAAYAGGAVLMPVSSIRSVAAPWISRDKFGVHPESRQATNLCSAVCETFEVSRTAARVRLEKLGLITRNVPLDLK